MSLSQECAEYIEGFEGFRPFIYDDKTGDKVKLSSGGNPTIGHGITDLAEDESHTVVVIKCDKIITELSGIYTHWDSFSTLRKKVLCSAAYQMGIEGLGGFLFMNRAIGEGDWDKAADEFLDSEVGRNPATHQRIKRESEDLRMG